jgi:hypothetical protein
LSDEDACGSDGVIISVGTGLDRRIVPPYANAGEEATRVKAAAMIMKRNMALPMSASPRHQLKSHAKVACQH